MHQEIIFSGFGGQGALFAGQLLAYAALDFGSASDLDSFLRAGDPRGHRPLYSGRRRRADRIAPGGPAGRGGGPEPAIL